MKPHEEYAESTRELFKEMVCDCACTDSTHGHDEYSDFCKITADNHKTQCAIIVIKKQIEENKKWMNSYMGNKRMEELNKSLEYLKNK